MQHELPLRAPDWIAGLWRRDGILFPDGTADRSTRVLWGQTHTLYVDVRIPADRPRPRGRRSFDDYSLDELQQLSEQKGFAGHICLAGDVCSWIRYIDYRPSTGRPDSGRVWRDGDTLYEEGDPSSVLASAYRETYRRERTADRCAVALQSIDTDTDDPSRSDRAGAILVVIDDRFLFARPRSTKLPPAETLRELIVAAGENRELIYSYLDCEVSFGEIGQAGDGWTIACSTIPHREGRRLLARSAAAVGGPPDVLSLTNDAGTFRWRIVESTIGPAALVRLFGR